jgi:hydroxyacylglutathione hydrolase
MRVVSVPCLKDNYAYLVVCEGTNRAAIVDPSEAAPVLEAVEREKVELVAIWNTHHHWDHTGGNKDLLESHPELEVIGHESDKGRIPGQTTFAEEGDVVELSTGVKASIIFNPGHTTGAISFYIAEHKAVFTGDTLFAGGCGRMFEGTAPMFWESMTKLAALPEDTDVYSGHEYTASNLKFAAAVEPENAELAARIEKVAAQRDAGAITMPSTIKEERETNPFCRTDVSIVIEAAKANEPQPNDAPHDIFHALREWKNRF